MIEKIRTTEQGLYNEHGTFLGTMPKDTDSLTLANKINELVDAVNELHEEAKNNACIRANHENLIDTLVAENNIHERQIDELQMKVNELASNINFAQPEVKENMQADPYAEQRKWIGTLCKFWDDDDEEKWFSILEHIDKNSPYSYCASGDWWYKHCEPVKPDDDIIYKDDDNDKANMQGYNK